MKIEYNEKTDLLYLRFDTNVQEITNQRVSENIVLDLGENNKIVGIEIIDATDVINLEHLFPIKYQLETAV